MTNGRLSTAADRPVLDRLERPRLSGDSRIGVVGQEPSGSRSNSVANWSAAGTGGMPAPAAHDGPWDGHRGDLGRRWDVGLLRAPAADLLDRDWSAVVGPSVRFLRVARPALVLGSAQAESLADRPRLQDHGVDLARRRSGGGAVLVAPESMVWVDLVVPAGDRLWRADVGVAFHWLGEAWVSALSGLGITAQWHSGPSLSTPWSSVVCFAGLGAGEVTVDGRKVIGLSQRRNRAGVLFQCGAVLHWDAAALLDLLALEENERRAGAVALSDVVTGLAIPAPEVEAAFALALESW